MYKHNENTTIVLELGGISMSYKYFLSVCPAAVRTVDKWLVAYVIFGASFKYLVNYKCGNIIL